MTQRSYAVEFTAPAVLSVRWNGFRSSLFAPPQSGVTDTVNFVEGIWIEADACD